ncbi:teichuronic acid biosynthesis glycosyl transferase [Capnocytophaga cynodegmi]|uniref:Teichuronic acid biosynthesis glycosyl transferase n=1 Tax=Capnocytophaga cynodegmi TaxID=28189 RepID=A0A250E9S9_9FLAO|nr:glycosyltransferase family 2 protein [Capnocytophaga cynodegmi]ATA68508.1 teichuronic acid biosynthesis glycosyl transferase [Capnocytophaga cynodegmi]
MKQNLVSIITPMYNASKYVEQTIDSVLSQTYTQWEMLIVDDGSKDNSSEIVEQYADKDNRIKLIRQNNVGSAAARNNALSKAQGRYICFLDSDDLLEPSFFEKQMTFLKQKKAGLVFASYKRIDENGNEKLNPFIVPDEVTYRSLLKTCPISCLTSIYDKKIVGEQFFKEELKSLRDDYVYWLEMLKKIKIAYGNKEVLASYRVFTSSTTGNKKKVIKPQFLVYYKIEKLGLFKSLYYLTHWAFNGFFKYKK